MKNRIYITYYEILKQNARMLPTIKRCSRHLFTWGSNFHPFCTYFRIYTNPFYSELHIEEFLLNEIPKLENFKLPLQTSIWETSAHLKNYYEQNNFMEIRRTYMPILDVRKIISIDIVPNSNYHLQTLSNILSDNNLLEKLAYLVKEIYEQTHLANPVAHSRYKLGKK